LEEGTMQTERKSRRERSVVACSVTGWV
jgi:hypothetical protein